MSSQKAIVGVGVLLMALVLVPAAASAHAVLLRATPSGTQTLAAAPAQVQLLFSEPIDPLFSDVRVQDAAGQRVDTGDSHVEPDNDHLMLASLRPGLGSGVYTVTWRSLSSIDVHADVGQYQLFVGVPVQQPTVQSAVGLAYTGTPETTIGRWWFYVAASLFGGVLATWKLVLAPVLADASDAGTRAVVHGRVRRLVLVGGVLLILGTLFSAVAQAGAAANVPLGQALGQPLADLLLRGRFAAIWWPRLGLEIASLALIAFGGIDGLASECALATLPAVLLTSALTSHGAALPLGAGPGIAIDWLHIVGATLWVGGLLALTTCFGVFRREALLLGKVVRRFARLALVAASLVLLSGVLQSGLELGSWSALVSSLYGQLVLIKVLLLVAMLGLAGMNEWRARASGVAAMAQVRGFGRGVGLELALGVLVFGVAALLSSTPPSSSI